MGDIWEKQGKLYDTYGKSPNYMEAKIAGKIIELNGELFHYKVFIAGGYFSSYGIPWNSSSMEFAR